MSSEITRIREQIALEYEAAQRALYSPAMVARHDFINKRMENVGELHEKLSRHIGMEEATKTVLDIQVEFIGK